jgi:hypothetical protein
MKPRSLRLCRFFSFLAALIVVPVTSSERLKTCQTQTISNQRNLCCMHSALYLTSTPVRHHNSRSGNHPTENMHLEPTLPTRKSGCPMPPPPTA